MEYQLGIDVATTGTKSLLIDESGDVVAVGSSEYEFQTPRPLWSEQDPRVWWEGAVSSIREALSSADADPKAVRGVGLTGQMHGLVVLDEAGEVLRPAILWNDQRTGAECDEIRERVGREHLIQTTGNDALAGFTAPKILWVRNHEPEVYDRIAHVLLPKDYVRYRLTGEFALDRAGGSGTILFDLERRDWSDEVLDALEIPRGWLPETHEGPEVTGRIRGEASSATGLAEGTPVVAGGGDQQAQAVGVGAVEEGTCALTLGTSGVVFAPTERPAVDPDGRIHAFCHAAPDRWNVMGVVLSAAGSLQWYRDTLAHDRPFDELVEPAGDVEPGSNGLLYLPYLTGERTPHPDPMARGAFVGLTVRHDQSHLTRAVLEGVAFALKDSFELIRGMGRPVEDVHISGGGSRSPLWRQILADVFEAPLHTVNTTEGASYGAALLAGVGSGTWNGVSEACETCVVRTGTTEPRTETRTRYRDAYRQYRGLYPDLKDRFAELAALDPEDAE